MIPPRRLALSLALVVATAAAAGAGCNVDPVHSAQVAALGPEAANIPVGQYHRAGQPCGVCHGPDGPASTTFSIAGTVFYGPGSTSAPIGVSNAAVVLEDDTTSKTQVLTNCVGNFFISPSDWNPEFPVIVTVAGSPEGTSLQVPMTSLIGRTSSCGTCHLYPTNLDYFQTPGIIHLANKDDPSFKGDPSCPVQPPVPVGLGGM